MKTINFSPDGDTIPVLFDQYDAVCRDYFEGGDGVKEHKNKIFEFTHFYEKDLKKLNRYLPRFSHIAFFVQMPHLDVGKKVEEMKGAALTEADKKELDFRVEYANKWLEACSPEKYIFKVQEEVPDMAGELSGGQKEFLKVLAGFLKDNPNADGEKIQSFIHDKKNELEMEPADIFKSIYVSILGKDSGPQAGWLMEALENEFLIKRFEEASEMEKAKVDKKAVEIPEERLSNDYFYLSSAAAEKYPEVQIAFALIEGIEVNDGGDELKAFREDVVPGEEEAASKLKSLDILKQYVEIYRRMGVDVTKRKPTSCALFDRLAKGKGLYEINNVVDVCNLMTLEDGISFGAFDMDNIAFPIVFDIMEGGEEFWPLMEKKAKKVDAGEFCMQDADGKLLNRDYNYRDSDYTKIVEGTKNIFLTMDSLEPMPIKEVKEKFDHSLETFVKYCGGMVKFKLVA